jgi:hypothetical protein
MEYVSQKTVTILERRLGLMHLFFFVLIMGYMVGVRLILERGYLAVELSHGFVSATLEGNTYSMGGGQSYAVDSPELIGPQLESNALFVPTTVATTRGQRQDNCTDPAQPCNADADCMRLPPLAYGLCEDGRCMQLGWCPRENIDVTQVTVLQNLRDLNVILTADMHFPRLGSERMSTEDGRKARTSWSLSSLIRRAGVPYATAVSDGLVLSCVLEWACDLNPGAAPCVPRLRVFPLAQNASFNVEWATYHQVRDGKRAYLPPSLTHLLPPSLPPSLTPSLPHSRTHLLPPSLPPSLAPSLTHSSLPPSLRYARTHAACPLTYSYPPPGARRARYGAAP